jgi:hypothetical protein
MAASWLAERDYQSVATFYIEKESFLSACCHPV